LIIISLIWIIKYDELTYKCNIEKEEAIEIKVEKVNNGKTKKSKNSFYAIFVVLDFFAIVNNFAKDGLSSWTPSLLKEKYDFKNRISVLLLVGLPLFAL
jgi:hypothetical protein